MANITIETTMGMDGREEHHAVCACGSDLTTNVETLAFQWAALHAVMMHDHAQGGRRQTFAIWQRL